MSQRGMSTIGTVVAVVLVTVGLAVVGFFIMLTIAFQSYGSNK